MLRKALKAARDPIRTLRTARYKARKKRQDRVRECQRRPKRLAELFNTAESDIRRYESELHQEPRLDEFHRRKRQLVEDGVVNGTTSEEDCVTMYLVCRILEPETVVETGVLYGAFDTYILAALEHNDGGSLYSLDLPDGPNSEYPYGYAIPDAFRDRWNLQLGDAREMLDEWCEDIGCIDVFLHDSLHTKSHMEFEYETAYPYVREGGVIASHDVLLSDVFESFAEKRKMTHTSIVNTGVAVKT